MEILSKSLFSPFVSRPLQLTIKVLQQENINTEIRDIDDYFKSAISVDCVIFGYQETNEELQLLTLECNMDPYKGLHSLVGDLVREDENLDEAASRVLFERAGIRDVFLQQVHAFGAVNRHPAGRVVSVAYYALVKISDIQIQPANIHHPTWQPLSRMQNEPLAFDHDKILNVSLQHIRQHIIDLPVEYMLPDYFTLSQLQSLYEAILQKQLDKRNFRKKVLKLELIEETPKSQENVAHRPAKLYCLNQRKKQGVL